MASYLLTPAAEKDLQKILDYLYEFAPHMESNILVGLDRAMHLLAVNPCMGHMRSDLTTEDLRFWPVYRYLIVYDPHTSPLQLLRVLHTARDVQRLLNDEE